MAMILHAKLRNHGLGLDLLISGAQNAHCLKTLKGLPCSDAISADSWYSYAYGYVFAIQTRNPWPGENSLSPCTLGLPQGYVFSLEHQNASMKSNDFNRFHGFTSIWLCFCDPNPRLHPLIPWSWHWFLQPADCPWPLFPAPNHAPKRKSHEFM